MTDLEENTALGAFKSSGLPLRRHGNQALTSGVDLRQISSFFFVHHFPFLSNRAVRLHWRSLLSSSELRSYGSVRWLYNTIEEAIVRVSWTQAMVLPWCLFCRISLRYFNK